MSSLANVHAWLRSPDVPSVEMSPLLWEFGLFLMVVIITCYVTVLGIDKWL